MAPEDNPAWEPEFTEPRPIAEPSASPVSEAMPTSPSVVSPAVTPPAASPPTEAPPTVTPPTEQAMTDAPEAEPQPAPADEKPAEAEAKKPAAPAKKIAPKKAPTKKAAPKAKPREEGRTGKVLSVAADLSGIPYVWGGTSTRGFDCSGYSQHVFNKAGVNLPRTAAQQQDAVKRVSNPQPGDLVFFGSPAHHVGIYAGKGKMYDAPRTGRTTGLHRIWSSNVTYGRP